MSAIAAIRHGKAVFRYFRQTGVRPKQICGEQDNTQAATRDEQAQTFQPSCKTATAHGPECTAHGCHECQHSGAEAPSDAKECTACERCVQQETLGGGNVEEKCGPDQPGVPALSCSLRAGIASSDESDSTAQVTSQKAWLLTQKLSQHMCCRSFEV